MKDIANYREEHFEKQPTLDWLTGQGQQNLLANELSQNTKQAYLADFKHFAKFCENYQLEALPCSLEALMAYLTHYAGKLKVSVLTRRLVAIRRIHQIQGVAYPNNHLQVKRLLQAIKRTHGSLQAQAKPCLSSQVLKAVAACSQNTLTGIRDKTILLLGFIGAFRRAELVNITVADLQFDERGLTIFLPKSKTDQFQKGDYKVFPFHQNPDYCPVMSLKTWLEVAQINKGAVFLRIRKGEQLVRKKLTDKSIYNIAKKHLGSDFSPHSLRAGFVTQARKNGANDLEIMRQTKHKTRTMIDRYTRIESAWENNAAFKL